MNKLKKVLIVGGGFGGIRLALDLARAQAGDFKIVLATDKPHFEYHAALYRLVTGRSPLEVCVPLADVFAGTDVEIVIDTIEKVDLENHSVQGSSGSSYSYDFLILALGSETSYFNIPGLREQSYGFKSITEALRLKRHLHELFEEGKNEELTEKVKTAHFVVVGGGASGVELAGELAVYMQNLAVTHGFDPKLVTIDLIEAASRLVSMLPAEFGAVLEDRLRQLGVNIFLNRTVLKEDVEQVYLKDMQMKTKTVIWTAGIKPHHLYGETSGVNLDKKARVIVDDYLEIPGFPGVFVVGDAAATTYAGMAQTAIHDSKFVAEIIRRKIDGRNLPSYQPKKPLYAIPVGPGWAGVIWGGFKFYGRLGWMLRRYADLRFFLSILPFYKALLAFQNERTLCESCLICAPDSTSK